MSFTPLSFRTKSGTPNFQDRLGWNRFFSHKMRRLVWMVIYELSLWQCSSIVASLSDKCAQNISEWAIKLASATWKTKVVRIAGGVSRLSARCAHGGDRPRQVWSETVGVGGGGARPALCGRSGGCATAPPSRAARHMHTRPRHPNKGFPLSIR